MINQLKPVEVVRNQYGEWTHPEVDAYLKNILGDDAEFMNQEQWDELKRHFNIVTVKTYLESTVSPDEFDEIMDDADLSKWQPLAPHGFFLMSIYFTEDGADAIWAKEKQVEGAEG
ncbi:hypothetical protein NQ785_08615 [Acinetobacter baumannii]|nr:hypothetical protein [Acinetobacter baumannii]